MMGLRILHLTTFLQGGAGRVIKDLALEQQRGGADVTVVTSRTGAPGYGNYPDYLRQLETGGVRVAAVDSLFTRDLAANLDVLRALDRLFARGQEPDLIHAHAAVPSLVGLLFTGSRGRGRVVQTMHGWGISKTPAQAAHDVAVMNLVDRVFVPSAHAARQLAGLGVDAARIERVPYRIGEPDAPLTAVDRPHCEALRAARRRGALAVACVGTIGARKNQHLIVEAIASLPDPSTVYCLMLGDGEADELRRAAQHAGVSDSVVVAGFTPAARLIAREADVLVLPSRNEGQPLAVLEALADGLPVLAAATDELAELVEDGVNGWFFRPGDAKSLAAMLAGLRAGFRSPDEDSGRVEQLYVPYERVHEAVRAD